MKIINTFLFVSLFYIVGCSATKETDKDTASETQSVYVFDDITTTDTLSTAAEEVPVTEVSKVEEESSAFEFYIVQLGAFSTLEKAETFVNSTKDKTDYELNIHYSEKVNLHVVQLTPFRSREKADEVRDELRNIPEFNGAFIVPNNKNK
ncbi:MAG: SPOR domain-containing protein [Melioribacteraceae bacterium]|nr:SPOR domain-containing protein [Melioribacteraceae bacterium]